MWIHWCSSPPAPTFFLSEEAEKLKAKEGFIFETSIKSGKDNVYLVNKLFSYLKYGDKIFLPYFLYDTFVLHEQKSTKKTERCFFFNFLFLITVGLQYYPSFRCTAQ